MKNGVNRALVAKKTFKLFNFNWRSSATVQAEGCTKFISSLCLILTMLFTLGVGEMWAGAGFYEVYFTYSYSGTSGNATYTSSTSTTQTIDLGTLTADFKITSMYLKYWKDGSGNMCGGLVDYYISSDQEYQPTWTWQATGGNNHELQSTANWTVAQYNTGASGSYTFWYRFKTWGSSSSSSGCSDNYYIPTNSGVKNKFTYNIAPPAISSFSVAESGYLSGSGTSGDPYIIPYNGTLTLTVSGSKGRTDANSTIKYWKNSGDKQNSNVLTVTGITSTTKASVVIHTQCINNDDSSLTGTESTKTVYYKSEAAYSVTAAKTPSAGGSVTPSSATNMGTISGGDITATPNTGYDFTSWAITSGSGYFGSTGTATTSTTASTKFRPSAAATVTATFTPQTYNITYKDQGDVAFSGTHGDGYPTTHTYGTATALVSPTKTGYTFGGWYTNSTCTTSAGSSIGATSKTADFTLYAKWTEIMHDVRVGTSSYATTSPNSWTAFGEVTGGTVSATSIATGYRFNGWSSDKSGTFADASSASTTFYPAADDVFVTASIIAKTYSITLDKNGGDSNGSTTATYNSNTLTSFSGAAYEGFSCDGYFTASDGGTKIINANGTLVSETVAGWLSSGYWVNDGADITLYAHWTEDATYYTLTYGVGTSSSGNVTVSAAKTSDESSISTGASLVSGTGVTITATPASHYKFVGWYTSTACLSRVSTNNPYSFSLEENTALYAKVEKMTTTITLDANGGAGGTTSVTAEHGSRDLSSSITIPTRTGYTLAGWYTAASGGSRIILKAGTTTGPVAGYTDASGYWLYEESTLTLYAHWTANTYKVTFDKQSGSGGSDNVTATYNSAMPSATMPTRTGYDFNGYYGSTGGSGTKYYNSDASSAHVWDQAGARTIYAYWTAHNYSITYSPVSAPTGCTYTTAPSTGAYGSTVTMVLTPATGYSISVSAEDASSNTVTISNPSTNTYTFTQPASAVTVTVSASEIMRDITIEDGVVYGGSATTTTAGVATSAKITANDPDEGKKFTGWSLGTGVSLKGGYNLTDQTIEIYSTADATVTATYDDRDGVKMYFAIPYALDWSSVKAYVYQSDKTSNKNAEWPGVALSTTEDINCVKYYVYQYYLEGDGIGGTADGDEDWNTVIFNNGSSGDANQTADLTIANGHYYYKNSTTTGSESAIEHEWYIKSDKNEWGDDDPMTHDCSTHTATISINLAKDESYTFKMYDAASNTWWSNSSLIGNATSSVGATTLYNDDDGNMKITADKAGSYMFTITKTNTNAPEIAIQYPSQFLVGSWDSWDQEAHLFDEYGYYKLHLAAGSYGFKVKYNGVWYGLTDAEYTETIKDYLLYSDGGDMTLSVATAGDYVFGWNGADKTLSVIFPADTTKAQLPENRYLYFDSRRLDDEHWNEAAFSTRFWLKNYASGIDYSHVDCSNASVLEEGVYYALIPTGGKVGQVQLNRMSTDFSEIWNYTSKVYAIDRANVQQNCLMEEVGNEDWWDSWTPQWTTYCPPMSSATLTHSGTTVTYGGNGGESTPYLVAAGGSIYVSATSVSALNDANMTAHYQFKKAGEDDGEKSATATHTYTASSTNQQKQAMTVVASNYYNSTYGTASSASNAIYYESRTPYNIAYNKGSYGTGDNVTDIKVYGVNISIRSYLFTRTGYNQTAWDTNSAGTGGTSYASGDTYTGNAALTLYPTWTAKQCTVTFNKGGGEGGSDGTTATYDAAMTTVSVPHRIGYAFGGYWDGTGGTGTQYYNADGTSARTWNKDTESATTLYAKWTSDTNTFTGETNSNWATGTNWSKGSAPTDDYSTVTISSNVTIADGTSAHVGEILISAGSLTIEPGGALEVAGTIKKSNGDPTETTDIIVNTTASKQASLILDNSAADTKATVLVTTTAVKDEEGYNFQFIAVPMTSVGVQNSFAGQGIYTYVWNEGTGWERRGYYYDLFAFEAVGITQVSASGYGLTGTLASTEDQTFSLAYTSGSGVGMNMIGNSWTSPISIAALNGKITDATSTVYVYESGDWVGYPTASAGAAVIPAMQAYTILANSGGGSLKLKYDEAVRGVASVNRTAALRAPKREVAEMSDIYLHVSGNDRTTNLRLCEAEQFTNEFDNGWEAIYLEGDGRSGQLYAQMEDKMTVLATPSLEGTVVGFIPGNAANYTISFSGTETGYYLNDMLMEQSTLIAEGNTYDFTPDEYTNATRFVISKTPILKTPTGVEDTEDISDQQAAVRKLIIDDKLYIIRAGRIYNVTGALCK